MNFRESKIMFQKGNVREYSLEANCKHIIITRTRTINPIEIYWEKGGTEEKYRELSKDSYILWQYVLHNGKSQEIVTWVWI